jgi:hypothetical protein
MEQTLFPQGKFDGLRPYIYNGTILCRSGNRFARCSLIGKASAFQAEEAVRDRHFARKRLVLDVRIRSTTSSSLLVVDGACLPSRLEKSRRGFESHLLLPVDESSSSLKDIYGPAIRRLFSGLSLVYILRSRRSWVRIPPSPHKGAVAQPGRAPNLFGECGFESHPATSVAGSVIGNIPELIRVRGFESHPDSSE